MNFFLIKMKFNIYILVLFILSTLLYICNSAYINTKKSQEESKKRMHKKLLNNPDCIVKTPYAKRRRMDDDEEEIDPTLLVYDRCDHGHTPDDISDCTKYDTYDSSCCMFKYGQDTGCVLIGFKYLGSKMVGDMKVNCNNEYFKSFNLFLIIMIFLII